MSKVPIHNRRMIMKNILGLGTQTRFQVFRAGHRVIATFGAARLVRQADGRHELVGGTMADRTQAREWCSLFAPEVVFSPAPRTQGRMVLAV